MPQAEKDPLRAVNGVPRPPFRQQIQVPQEELGEGIVLFRRLGQPIARLGLLGLVVIQRVDIAKMQLRGDIALRRRGTIPFGGGREIVEPVLIG